MKHVVEVDQSGKIEDTKEDSVLAFANGKQYSILIPATVKRDCIKALRIQGRAASTFYLQLFTIALYFLLRDHVSTLYRVMIDSEYIGQEAKIKEHLINLLRRRTYKIEPFQIHFTHVGKSSPAHTVAWSTLRKKRQPDRLLKLEEMLGEFKALKKSGTP